MQNRTAIIYGIKIGDKYQYIGKKKNCHHPDGNLRKSDVGYQYVNSKIKTVFDDNQDAVVEPILIVPEDQWYDEKLNEVVSKHHDKHPLLNSKWMLEGKHGYWEGKTRDEYTINRLAESKYIKIVEYDRYGKQKKIWNSAKEVAIKVFGDYEVVNGSGKTYLYDKLNAVTLGGKFYGDSYWFRFSELLEYFNTIPKKLNLDAIYNKEKARRAESAKLSRLNKTHTSAYSVEKYVDGKLVQTFLNTREAGYVLKIDTHSVQKLCRKEIQSVDYELKYGKKILQPINPVYPKYKVVEIRKPKKNKTSIYIKHRTYYTVIHFDNNGSIITTYPNVSIAALKLGINEQLVRKICRGGVHKYILKYGSKVRINI